MISMMNPPVGYPMRPRMGWTLIVSGNPDVAAPVPALISADPNESPLGRGAGVFDDDWRRSDADGNLR
jgi:hypothetical protein